MDPWLVGEQLVYCTSLCQLEEGKEGEGKEEGEGREEEEDKEEREEEEEKVGQGGGRGGKK